MADHSRRLRQRDSNLKPGTAITASLLVTPSAVFAFWILAFVVASHRGAPAGDTTFAWMPLGAGVLWLFSTTAAAVAAALLRINLGWPALDRRRATIAGWIATIVTAATTLAMFGLTLDTVDSPTSAHDTIDGFPNDRLTLAVLFAGALLSMGPTVWMWRHLTRQA